jgi:hypothetical protein
MHGITSGIVRDLHSTATGDDRLQMVLMTGYVSALPLAFDRQKQPHPQPRLCAAVFGGYLQSAHSRTAAVGSSVESRWVRR